MSQMYELNDEEALRYLLRESFAELRATYEWVPAIEEELARQGTESEAVGNTSRTGPGWMVTVDYGSVPFIGVAEHRSLSDLDYEEVVVALCATLGKAHGYVQRTFKDSWIRNRFHKIHGSEEMFSYALSIELSEGAARLHERLALEPQLLQKHLGAA